MDAVREEIEDEAKDHEGHDHDGHEHEHAGSDA
jgi:hypothetical protein